MTGLIRLKVKIITSAIHIITGDGGTADKEVRDNRVTFFATYLGKGEYEFSYIMQAQIPGDYIVNPAKGMLMYYPEVNGNSESIRLKY